jgi:ABC-2 type transport system permease protein
MGGRSFILIAGLALVTGFIALPLIIQPLVSGIRLDVTQDRLHTLSDGARESVSSLTEPVDLTLYYSRQAGLSLPRLAAHARQIDVLLDALVAASDGKLRVTRVDPEPFSLAEDAAISAGLIPLETRGADRAWLGVEGRNALGDRIVIPFLSPSREAGLEYELVRMIAALDQPKTRRIIVISSLSSVLASPGAPQRPRVLDDLARGAELIFMPRDFASLPEADLLLMIHPWPLTARQEWLVDQFILTTGRALLLVDPLALGPVEPTAGTLFATRAGPVSGLGRLGLAWGASLGPGVVLSPETALPVEAAGPGGTVPQPLFFRVPTEAFSQQNLMTAGLERGLHFGAAGSLRLDAARLERAGLSASPLIGAPQGTVEVTLGADDDLSPTALTEKARGAPERDQRADGLLGVSLTGLVKSAFEAPPNRDADGLVRQASRADRAQDIHVSQAETPVQILVLADTDFLDDGLYFDAGTGVTLADNAALMINAVDFLTGSQALMTLRGRAPALRPMTALEARRGVLTDRYRTEQAALDAELNATQTRIDALRRSSGTSALARFEAETEIERELNAATERAVEIRARLRAIEGEWQAEIKRTELELASVNIFAMPALIGFMALVFALWRTRRRKGLS